MKPHLLIPDVDAMYRDMGSHLEKFCTCETCGARVPVNPAQCLREGWPKCCGQTMTLGEPKKKESDK